MWIVKLALSRKYTFFVMALVIMLLGVTTIQRTPKDVFPNIDIPVVSMIWTYTGITPTDMERRIVTVTERASTTTVSDLEHIESQSLPGLAVIKFYFQPGAKVEAGVAQLTSIAQTLLRILPTGTTSPFILSYSASSVPILQLALSSSSLSESQLNDAATNVIRTKLATVRGASVPTPYGGESRDVEVDLDPQALQEKGITPIEVSNALNAQNVILPTGTEKIGPTEYQILLNGSPMAVADLNSLPIKVVNGSIVTIKDVARVHMGYQVQQNVVAVNGRRSVLITVLKNGDASTIDVVQRVKAALPGIQAQLPGDLKIEPLFDQSVFVKESVSGVVREAVISATLTALMILVFLGSWRSTLTVAISIPLAILTSICVLGLIGETLNTMTLGGLALAVGILVDDATVELENIYRNLHAGKPLTQAILDSASEIAVPTFVATLSICIVFVSVVFLTGPAKFLFTPLALAVVFAMLASYLLSRTVIPVTTLLLLRKEATLFGPGGENMEGDVFWNFHRKFDKRFEEFAHKYAGMLKNAIASPKRTILMFAAGFAVSLFLLPFIGRDFFPRVDAGQLRMHIRTPAGTRIEETTRQFAQIERTIRRVIPPSELALVLQNIGLPTSGINLAFSDTTTISAADGEMLISLKDGHRPSEMYEDALRTAIKRDYPKDTVFFQPADITSQTLNFGLPAPIDVQVVGRDPKNYDIARRIASDIRKIPGSADVYVHQVLKVPSINVDVDRNQATFLGLTERDVASSLLISLSGSGQTAPNYWLDPKTGVNYQIVVQTPQYKVSSIQALENTSVNTPGNSLQIMSNLAQEHTSVSPQNITHYDVQPTYDVYVNVANRDLGGVASDVDKVLAKYKKLPRGTTVKVRGQVDSMNTSFTGLGIGILFAIVLVYLLIVVNFQNWIDPLVIVCALPGAMSGILWMLFITGTPFSVPALMGTIMCVGVATSNSILVITFADERRAEGYNAVDAAQEAGHTRLRPVLMTALAMIIGMFPMALGLGEGGEQNAPLGRAVIGGLLFATVTTLFFVPTIYTILRRNQPEDEKANREYIENYEPTVGNADQDGHASGKENVRPPMPALIFPDEAPPVAP